MLNKRWGIVAYLTSVLLSSGAPSGARAALLINQVTIIDGTGRPPKPARWVLIEGDRIVAIRDHAIAVSSGTPVVDGRGKFLIPGLFDVHIHLNENGDNSGGADMVRVMDNAQRLLQGYLYCGVTTVYDAGNDDQFIFGVRDAERSGRIVSPHIFAAGYAITRAHGFAQRISRGVDTYTQGTEALDALFANKPDLVKFFLVPHGMGGTALPAMDPALLHRLVLYANGRGFRTTVHATESATMRSAVESGIDSLAHPVFLDEMDGALVRMIAARGLPVATTLMENKTMFSIVDEPRFFDDPMYRAILTDADIAFFRDKEFQNFSVTLHSNTPGMEALVPWARGAYKLGRANLRQLYDAGAILALGTDRTYGSAVHQELESLVDLGIPPLQALRIGTLNGAKYLHEDALMGSIEEGKIADLVLLNADPLQNIKNTRTISSVILGGKSIDRVKLDRLPINDHGAER